MTFEEAKDLFATAKDKSCGKPLMNNTRLYGYDINEPTEHYEIVLHGTPVVAIYKNRYIINARDYRGKDWLTVTTKKRINDNVPNIRVYTYRRQHKIAWGWDSKNLKYSGEINFMNGAIFNEDGFFMNPILNKRGNSHKFSSM